MAGSMPHYQSVGRLLRYGLVRNEKSVSDRLNCRYVWIIAWMGRKSSCDLVLRMKGNEASYMA